MKDYYDPRDRRKKKKKNSQKGLRIAFAVILCAVLLAVVGVLIYLLVRKEPGPVVPSVSTSRPEDASTQDIVSPNEEVLKHAKVLAAMYDYDGAVEYIKTEVPDYTSDLALSVFINECAAKKTKLIKWPDNSTITHIFFHTLVADNATAWSSYNAQDYNTVMTTIDEFNKIMQIMYDEGYVLVHLSDIAKIQKVADGTSQMTYQPIYLPKGKTPFVLSVDDVSYYEYMNNTGFATKLVIGEDGKITCEKATYEGTATNLKKDENGAPIVKSVEYGAFDVVPLLDAFVEAHPDFSYRGAKGTIALTGYNGVLGYRTSDIAYGAGDPDWPGAYEYRNVNLEADKAEAKRVADAMKAEGWKFASHTWGHMNMSTVVTSSGNELNGKIQGDRFKRDTEWWMREVSPIIGPTDIIIFAFGADIGTWRTYNYFGENEAFMYLKSLGFDYYCNVDSSKHAWVQLSPTDGGSGYLRMARRNLDGQLMFKTMVYEKFYANDEKKQKNILSDLFDPKVVFDRTRPLPVPGVVYPEGADLSKIFE